MKKIIILLFGILSFTACQDLDIAPKNIVTDDDLLTNEAGMDIYLAKMYSAMPFEEFKYMALWGVTYNSWLGALGIEGTGEAITRDGISISFTSEQNPYWGNAFILVRAANHLIETLPQYQSSFQEATYKHFLGEAYFVRAFVFYKMAQRYGGIPLVTKVIEYPAEKDQLEIPRSSEEETWDQICADFDQAAALLQPTSFRRGYANKYVALAFKSEAMLYAGSVAKYNEVVTNRLTGFGEKTGVRVIGFAEESWQAASKRYFKEAYKAAGEIILNGGYSLYMKKWKANDPEAQYQNMVDMFSDLDSPENMLVKEYKYPTLTHGIDGYSGPYVFRGPLAGGTCPTLDFVELFDGLDRYPDGRLRVTTGNTPVEGDFLLFDKTMDIFKNVEPRLRAYVILPGDMFKGQVMEERGGVYTGTLPVKPFFAFYKWEDSRTWGYASRSQYTAPIATRTLHMSTTPTDLRYVDYNGVSMCVTGANGPFLANTFDLTGFWLRKYLNPDPAFAPGEGKSEQPFILMRFADVLLNIAEAAVEMRLAGEPSPDGRDLMDVATEAVNAIRYRAGANLLTSPLTPNEAGRNIVRKERRKELAFEHKTKWDLRRWRVLHWENRDGLWGEIRDKTVHGNSSSFGFRGLYPFFSTQAGKYYFDSRYSFNMGLKTFSYSAISYYFGIPGGEVSKSQYIDQQPNR
jgi:hypothetical protein